MGYQVDPQADIRGTVWAADVELVPAELVRAFGAPHQRSDAYKVSGVYLFREGVQLFTLYDWKSTSLYDDDLPSPLAFWNSRQKVIFSVGSNFGDVADFTTWLVEAVAEQAMEKREEGF